jgi:hypothetical protein
MKGKQATSGTYKFMVSTAEAKMTVTASNANTDLTAIRVFVLTLKFLKIYILITTKRTIATTVVAELAIAKSGGRCFRLVNATRRSMLKAIKNEALKSERG